MSAHAYAPTGSKPVPQNLRVPLIEWAFVAAATLVIVAAVAGDVQVFGDWRLLVWLVVIATVELFPIPTWGGAQFSVTDPLILALSIIYPPQVAVAVVFIGSFDPREFRRSISLRQALWNRSQLALSIFLASVMFHAVAREESSWIVLTTSALLMATVYNGLNVSAVAVMMSLRDGLGFARALRGLLLDAPIAAAATYLSFAVIGTLIARLYTLTSGSQWVLASFALPLVIVARSTYLHIRSARKAAEVSEQRATLLRTLSDRVAKERGEERGHLAGLLHDEAIPYAEGINLTANVALAALDSGHEQAARQALTEIREASLGSAAELRSLVGDLRRSPLEGRSLPEALRELPASWPGGPRVIVHAEDAVEVSDAAGLLLYLIAREAVSNAIKHSKPTEVHAHLVMADDQLELSVADDGLGFDPAMDHPGHFGLTLMRERAEALSGRLAIDSHLGKGTTVTVKTPLAGW